MSVLICSIDEFVVVDGKSIAKLVDNLGGHYTEDDIPADGTNYEIVSGDTVDIVGDFRAASHPGVQHRFSSKAELVKYFKDRGNPFW